MIADIKKSAEQKMKKTLETLKADFGKIRTGRAHAGLLDHVLVDYYGTPTPVSGVANVTLLDARTLAVTPYDKKMAGVVEKAIRDSDLGLNPATSGDIVRVPMPALTEERRRDLSRSCIARPRTRASRCATSAATPTIISRICSRRNRSPRMRNAARRTRCRS